MNKQEFLILYQYNAWSNAKILDAASNITQEQFLASVSFPHGSLRGTLLHILFAEWVWRKRWEGTPNNPGWKLDDFPTLESLRVRWAERKPNL